MRHPAQRSEGEHTSIARWLGLLDECVLEALREMHRVLQSGGGCLLTFHLGQEDTNHDELFGQKVDLDVALFTTAEITGYLQAAGFVVEESLERDPYAPEVEYQSRRGYVLASKPQSESLTAFRSAFI